MYFSIERIRQIISICEHFEERYSRYVKNFKTKPLSSNTLEILNVMPKCHSPDRDILVKSFICTFVKKTNIYKPEVD